MTTPPDNKPKDQPAELQDNPFEAPRGQTPPDSMRSPVRPETDEEALQNTPLGTPISFRKVMDEAPETPLDIPTVAPGGLPPMQPSNTWARPQPVQHDRNLRSWMYFFASICVLVALWIPLRAIYQRSRYRPLVVSERDADSFIAIAYGGISAGKIQGAEEVSRFEFGRQVEALRKAGFNPIGLQDVYDFYHNDKLLPPKAILLTMEQGKKNSYLETRDILRQNRWKAVMFVRGDTIAEKDPSALRWPILRDMSLSGTWEVGAESIHGFHRIPSGPEGETGNFFASPLWIEDEQRLERPNEFVERIRKEHDDTVAEFTREMGEAPLVFAYPYGDYGQYDPRAVSIRVQNMDAVADLYGVGFSLGPFMLNTKFSDPRALNRLLVNPVWDLNQFMSIMESGGAIQAWDMEDPLSPNRWLTDWGQMLYPEDGGMWLRAVPRGFRASSNAPPMSPTTGGLSWMVGSDLFGDFTVKIRFSIHAGQFGIRLRSRAGGEEGIRLLFDLNGNCWVHQKVFGAPEFIQAAVQGLEITPESVHELTLSLAGRNLFATLDGRMMLKEPLDLMGSTAPGLFGLEVWDPEPGAAGTFFESIEFPRPGQILAAWPSEEAYNPLYLMQTLNEDAYRWAVISPPWLDAIRAIPLVLPRWDDETIRTFSDIYKVPVMPRMTMKTVNLVMQIPPDLLADDTSQMEVDGLTLDCRLVAQEEFSLLVPWLQTVYEKLKEHDMKLALQFPTSVIKLASFASIAALFPGSLIAVESRELADSLEGLVENVIISEDLSAPPAADVHLNLFYQLAAQELGSESVSPQAHQDKLRRDGYEAYQSGRYDEAIAKWGEWLEEDPYSAEALSLIGRAYMQKEDLLTALDYYTRSLSMNPGQINMVVRRAELLEKLKRDEEAMDQLNLYARIFPENPEILIAQAQWLDRHQRRVEAREMLETLVHESPNNLAGRTALLNIQENPADRYATMREVLALGDSPDARMQFGHSLLSMEMLTFPESGVFFDFIRQQSKASQGNLRGMYESFLPLTNRVTDDFASAQLSDGWIASGGIRAINQGRYELQAAIDQSETYLRLRRSELMRDGFLEVVMDESQGFFWVYARRSSRTQVRFGFDQDGNIHLQAWYNGEIMDNLTRAWIRPPGSLKVRLEIRGDGARGFVNDLEIFDAPLSIPQEVAYGWWGVAPFAFLHGLARVRIIRMDCEPMPTTMLLVPPGNPEEQTVAIRPFVGGISALMPAWIFQNPDGSLPNHLPHNADVFRMFTSFHRIRLLPVIDLSYDGNVNPTNIVDIVRRHRLPGVVVKRRTIPTAEWLTQLQMELETHPANIIILQTEKALWDVPEDGENAGTLIAKPKVHEVRYPDPGETIGLWELPVSSVLIPPLQDKWNLPLHLPDEDPEDIIQDCSTPQLFIMGLENELSLIPPP